MKHLLIFEKFKSLGISNTIKFIKSKSKISTDYFISDLRDLLEIYDFPINEFTDDDINYMSAIKAKSIKTDDDIINPFGVYAIKFWFSLNEYLGYTGTGNIGNSTTNFSEYEMNKLKELGYETGTLTYLYDLSQLKTGDKIAGYFNEVEDMSYFTMATLYKSGDSYYAIQDVNDGSSPIASNWRQYGRMSWGIGDGKEIFNDNSKLHLWKPSDDKLKINNENRDFYIQSNGLLSKKGKSIKSLNKIEEADFSLVIYLDRLIKHESVKDIRKFREETKKGATALMSDEEIKKLNYKRYISNLINKSGINIETTNQNVKDLQNIILKILVGKWSLITLYKRVPNYVSNIDIFLNSLKQLINSKEEEKNIYMNRFLSRYEEIIKDSKSYESRFKGSMERVEKEGNENTKKMVNEVINMSIYFQNKLKNYKIDTIEDVLIILYKLKSFESYMENSSISFENPMNVIISNFHYNDIDVSGGVNYLNSEGDSGNDGILKRLDLIKRFIDKNF